MARANCRAVSGTVSYTHLDVYKRQVLVVGHQPTLGEVAAQLLGCEGSALSIKKGALWWFSRREGSEQITLRLVITPDFL